MTASQTLIIWRGDSLAALALCFRELSISSLFFAKPGSCLGLIQSKRANSCFSVAITLLTLQETQSCFKLFFTTVLDILHLGV
jgi:hypothetical protein